MSPVSGHSAPRLPRRSFLAIASAWLGSCFMSLGTLGCRVFRPHSPAITPGTSSVSPDLPEEALLDAVVSRLMPSGDSLPGAKETGVMDYLRNALTERHWSLRRDRILEGCQHLQSLAREQYGDAFDALPPKDQDALLRHLENGRVDTDTFAGQQWLHDLLELTLEGFLGDPVHGGNRDELGWSVIGYAPAGPRPGSCSLHRGDEPGAGQQR